MLAVTVEAQYERGERAHHLVEVVASGTGSCHSDPVIGARPRRRISAFLLSLVLATTVLLSSAPAGAVDPNLGPALLTGIEVQDLGTFDRVTLHFRTLVCIDVCEEPVVTPVPEILRAQYVDRPIVENPSGLEVTVEGGAVLQLVLSNASGFDQLSDPPAPSYTGPDRIVANLPSVIEVVQTGDFEAVMSFAIGVRDGAAGGTAQVLTDPTRVVVDIPHVTTAVLAAPRFTG
jgi:hypothetical protein